MGYRQKNTEFRRPHISLHIHSGRSLQANSRCGFLVSQPSFGGSALGTSFGCRHSGSNLWLSEVSSPFRTSRLAVSCDSCYPSLLASFPAIVSDGSGTPTPKRGVSHLIETTGRPVFAKAWRLDPEKHRIAEAEFQILEKACIVRR
jgi:hypothetical protein